MRNHVCSCQQRRRLVGSQYRDRKDVKEEGVTHRLLKRAEPIAHGMSEAAEAREETRANNSKNGWELHQA